MSETFEREAGRLVTEFGLVPEREEHLLAIGRAACPGDREHLIEREVRIVAGTGDLGERAVVALIPAQLRQRNEHLA